MELTRTDAIVQFTSGSATVWNNVNVPVPAGAVVIDTVNKIIKEGDGTTLFANLPVCLDYNFTGATSGAITPVGVQAGNIAIADDSLYTPSTAKLTDILTSITVKATASATQTSQIASLTANSKVVTVTEGTPDGTIVICNNSKYQPGDKTLAQLISDIVAASAWSTSMHLSDIEWYTDADLTNRVINQNDLTENASYFCKITGFHDTAELRTVDFGLSTTNNKIIITNSAKEESAAFIATVFGGSSNDRFNHVSVDAEGNVYAVGWTQSEGMGTPAQHNIVVVKYDKDLNVLLRIIQGGNGSETIVGCDVNLDGELLVAGFTNSVGAGYTCLITRYDSNLNILASKIFGQTLDDVFYGIRSDLNGNIFCVGTTVSEGGGGNDALIYKLDKSLNILARKTYGGSQAENFYAVNIDSQNNVYAVGFSESNGTSTDALIVKFDNNLSILARKHSTGALREVFAGVDIDASGNVYCTGWTSSEGLGNEDALVVKFDSNLTVLAKKRYGGTGSEVFDEVVVDASGNLYLSGYGSSDRGQIDALLIKVDSSLNVISKKYFGGNAGPDELRGMFVGKDCIYAAGYHTSAANGEQSLLVKCPFSLPAGTVTGTTLTELTLGDSNLTWADSNIAFVNDTLTLINSTLLYEYTSGLTTANSNMGSTRDVLVVARKTAPSKLVTAVYSSTGVDQFNDLVIDSTGAIICVGQTTNNGIPIALIVKFDSNMVAISRKLFSSSYSSVFHGVCVDASNNIVCAGGMRTSDSSLSDCLIVMFNSALDTITVQKTYSGTGDEMFYDVGMAIDGNFVAVGYTTSEGLGVKDALIIRYSTTLGLLARKRYGGAGNDVFTGIGFDTAGNFIAVGYTGSEGVNTSGLVIKFSSALAVVLRKFYNSSLGTTTEFNAVKVNSANEIFIAGRVVMATGNKGLMLKMDTSLAVVSNKLYGNTLGSTEFSGIALDADGNMFFVGKTNAEGVGNYDALIVKLSNAFVVLGKKTYGTFGADGDIMCVTDSNKDLLISGYATLNGTTDAVLTKVPGGLPLGVFANKKFTDLALNDSNLIYSGDTAVNTNSVSTLANSALTPVNSTLTLSNASGAVVVDKLVLDAVSNVFQVKVGDVVTSGSSVAVDFTLTTDDGDSVLTKNVNVNFKTYTFMISLYGGTGVDRFTYFDFDSTGNIYACGNTTSEASAVRCLIAKFDSDFNVLNKKTYYETGSVTPLFHSLIIDASNNIYCFGIVGVNEYAVFVKFDSSLNVLANKRVYGAAADSFLSGVIDTNGNLFVLGGTESEGGIYNANAIIYKFDSSLNLLLKKQWGGAARDTLIHMDIDSNNYLYIVGYSTSEGRGVYDALIYKFDNNLNPIARKACYGVSNDYFVKFVTASNGNIFTCGSTTVNGKALASITEFDSNLNYIRTIVIKAKDSDTYSHFSGIAIDTVGNIYAAGYIAYNPTGGENRSGLLCKFDRNLNCTWSKEYNGGGSEEFWDVKIDSQNNIVCCGIGFASSTYDAVLMKFTQPVRYGYFRTTTILNVLIADSDQEFVPITLNVKDSTLVGADSNLTYDNSPALLSTGLVATNTREVLVV
jgi:hypothetical protein